MITTVGDEEQAHEISGELVRRRQAACVNILPGIKSVYRWKGKICRDGEMMLVVKTLDTEYEAVAETIRELHAYDVPEILAFDISRGDRAFLDWIGKSLDKDADFTDEEPDLETI